MSEKESCCVTPVANESMAQYWDANYSANDTQNWIETDQPSIMKWIDGLDLARDAKIFCAGVGDANIVDHLLEAGFTNIIANDISRLALDKLSNRVKSESVTLLHDDLIEPSLLHDHHGTIDLYIDRATLHFFTKCSQKDHYFSQLSNLLTPSGFAMIGVFSKNNKPKCCGLDLQLWSMQSLKNRLAGYKFISEDELSFKELNGNVRNYIYLLAKK